MSAAGGNKEWPVPSFAPFAAALLKGINSAILYPIFRIGRDWLQLMITATTELALQWLVYLAWIDPSEPVSPRRGAQRLNCSASYLAKISSLLVKAGILQSVRGARGGVILAKPPHEVTLLDVFEACQGLLTAAYCYESEEEPGQYCSFHMAMQELHQLTTQALSRWSLQDLLKNPARCPEQGKTHCKMYFEDCFRLKNSKSRTGSLHSRHPN